LTYLLDTSAVIAVIKDKPGVRRRLQLALTGGASVGVSSIVVFELRYGVARSERCRENAERLRGFLSGPINIVPFDDEDAETAGELRAKLETAGTPIGPYDVLIAAQALRIGAILVTANVREFVRVRGLTWENWTAKG
jgi:tRNA(fMet)-specific endonuclease VapC